MPNNIYKRTFNHYIIYETVCLVNQKKYAGCHATDNLDDEYLGSGKLLLRAIRKYGRDNFERHVIKKFDNPQDMFAYEKQLINEDFVLSSETYNLVVGGSGGFKVQDIDSWKQKLKESSARRINKQPALGMKHTDETKEQISKSSTGRTPWNKGLPGTFTGRKHTEKSKQQMSESTKGMYSGKKNPMYGKSAVRGRKWYNDGKITYYLFPGDANIIEFGLQLGRIPR